MAGTPAPWSGRIQPASRRPGDVVRIGDTLIPRTVTVDFTGDNGYPDMTARFEVRAGRPECVEVRILAKPHGRGITHGDLEVVSPDGMARAAFASFATRDFGPTADGGSVARFGRMTERDLWAVERDLAAAQESTRRTGRVTHDELVRVAEVYAAHLDGQPATAVQAVLGYGSARTTARRIKAAEEAGLLPPTTPGRKRGR